MSPKYAVLLALGILLIYLLLPANTYYWDGVLFSFYAEQVRDGKMQLPALFHPNHLLYTPFGYLICRAVWVVNPAVRAIRVLQAVNAVLSAGSVFVFAKLAPRFLRSPELNLFALLLFAFGATWWKFSTDADPYIASVLFCLAAFWFALRGNISGTIACHAAAMLFHELAVFLYVPLTVALRKNGRRSSFVSYLLITSAVVALAYAGAFAASPHAPQLTLLRWITSYAGDTPVTRSVRQLVVGYLGSYLKLFAGGKLSLIGQFFGPVEVCALAACLAALAASVWLWRRVRPSAAEAGEDAGFLWAWFIPFAVFLAIFDPASTFHKLFLWPPLVLLITAAIPARRALSCVAVAVALIAWNFGAFIWPHAHEGADPVLHFAHRLDMELPANAVVYYAAFSPDDWYLRYFGTKHDWKELPVPPHTTEPVCMETTALNLSPAFWDQAPAKWTLRSSQHDIRVACLGRN